MPLTFQIPDIEEIACVLKSLKTKEEITGFISSAPDGGHLISSLIALHDPAIIEALASIKITETQKFQLLHDTRELFPTKKPYKIEEIALVIKLLDSSRRIKDFFSILSLNTDLVSDLIKLHDSEIIKKIPAALIESSHIFKIVNDFGQDTLSFIPKRYITLAKRLLDKQYTIKDEFGFNKWNNHFCFRQQVHLADGHYFILCHKYVSGLKELSELCGGSLSGLELYKYKTPTRNYKGVDYTGVYVRREDLKKFPNAIPVDKTIIEKKYHPRGYCYGEIIEPYFSVTYGYVANGTILSSEETIEFESFSEFCSHLNGDLSGAELTGFDLDNQDISALNMENVVIDKKETDKILQKSTPSPLIRTIKHYPIEINNSLPVVSALHLDEYSDFNIYYISDLHLDCKIIEHCQTGYDIEDYLNEKIDEMVDSFRKGSIYSSFSPLVMVGDVSSSFELNSIFFKIFADRFINIIVVLGNHELWYKPYKSTIKKYRKLFSSLNIIFLQNGLYVFRDRYNDDFSYYNESALLSMSISQIQEAALNSRFIAFGGIGFAGLNQTFNANNGIYRNAISRDQEIAESQHFSLLYQKIKAALGDQQVSIITHMPMEDWSLEAPNPNWIYLHGHTHVNRLINSSVSRIYADNQVGYPEREFFLQKCPFNGTYDIFASYTDGIFEVTADQYRDFIHGKNILMEYSSQSPVIMIKKNGYYFFMRKHSRNYVYLNGGKPIKTDKDPQYFFDHMDKEVSLIMAPLKKYTALLQKVSSSIISLGGNGGIHGCIVDIDYYNHVYINPFDMTITPYYAEDMVNKIVYPNLKSLLVQQRPDLLENHKDRIKDLTSYRSSKNTQFVNDTSIYKISRRMRAMQYLREVNILRCWYYNDQTDDAMMLTEIQALLENENKDVILNP